MSSTFIYIFSSLFLIFGMPLSFLVYFNNNTSFIIAIYLFLLIIFNFYHFIFNTYFSKDDQKKFQMSSKFFIYIFCIITILSFSGAGDGLGWLYIFLSIPCNIVYYTLFIRDLNNIINKNSILADTKSYETKQKTTFSILNFIFFEPVSFFWELMINPKPKNNDKLVNEKLDSANINPNLRYGDYFKNQEKITNESIEKK